MGNITAVAIAIFVGALTSIQSAVNTNLGKYVGGIGAALISFLVGSVTLVIFYLIWGGELKNAGKVPIYLFIGGIFGAIFVFSMIKIIPSIGVSASIAGVVAGQLIAAIIIDHFGLLGLEVVKLNYVRIIGAVFLLVGVKMMSK